MTDTDAPEWPDPADKAHAVEQAKRLRNQVAEGGLRFEAYLPPSLALWLLDLIEQDTFLDPSEAVFVILGEHKGVVCGRGRNPTLRLWPAIFSGEIDVFPSERRNMGQEIGR